MVCVLRGYNNKRQQSAQNVRQAARKQRVEDKEKDQDLIDAQ